MNTKINLSKKQRIVYDFIAGFLKANGFVPSYVEIGKGVGLTSLATVHKHVHVLEYKGWISRSHPGARRSLELTDAPRKHRVKQVCCPNCRLIFRPEGQVTARA